jgi:hypothetical protein
MAGHVGQVALDRVAQGGVTAAAELDQHVAAVRAELVICQQLPEETRRGLRSRTTRRAGVFRELMGLMRDRNLGGRSGDDGDTADGGDVLTRLALLRSAKLTCPDVPFVSDALQAEATVPVTLLLHYASGFVEAGVSAGWWPGKSADATDWVSLRLAAICKLISEAEAAAEVHPDLRASA